MGEKVEAKLFSPKFDLSQFLIQRTNSFFLYPKQHPPLQQTIKEAEKFGKLTQLKQYTDKILFSFETKQ